MCMYTSKFKILRIKNREYRDGIKSRETRPGWGDRHAKTANYAKTAAVILYERLTVHINFVSSLTCADKSSICSTHILSPHNYYHKINP